MSELSIFSHGDKQLPVSISSLSAYQLHHLVFSLLPFSCNFSLKLAQILPTEENFLLCFRQFVSSSAEFMAVRLFLSVCGWADICFFSWDLLNQPYIMDQSQSAMEGRQPTCSHSDLPANFTN